MIFLMQFLCSNRYWTLTRGFCGGSKPRNGQIFRHPYSSSYKSSMLSHASLENSLAAKARMLHLWGSCSIEAGNWCSRFWHLKLMVWYPPISQRFCRRMAFGRAANSSPIPAPKSVLQGWPPSNPGVNLLRAVVYLSHSLYGFDTSQIQNCSHQQKHDITWT